MLRELAPGVYWMPPNHETDRPALGAIAGERDTLMVESGNSLRHARLFLDALATQPVPPPRYLVLPHSHWDHVFGAPEVDAIAVSTHDTARELATMATFAWNDQALDERVAAGIEIAFCRDMIREELSAAERAEWTVRIPDLSFDAELTIELGNRTVRLIHVGGDHAPDSCIVVVPGVVAFLSDCVYENLHEEPNYLTRRRLFPLLDRLLALDVAYYVLGHDDEPSTRAEFMARAQLMRTAGDSVRKHERNDDAARDALSGARPEDTKKLTHYVMLFRAGRAHEA